MSFNVCARYAADMIGGVYLPCACVPRAGCHFTSNSITSTGDTARGGSLLIGYYADANGCTVEVLDCLFDRNQITSGGGTYGGGLCIEWFNAASGARLTVAGIVMVV